ncbi:MAG TPA: serine/threonine-protein kinase [Myxococcales bacterium]
MADPSRQTLRNTGPGGEPEGSDPLIGSRLGEYLVQERIGAGGCGVVFAGVHAVIGKRVAIKVLQWESAQNPEEAARLKAEARLVNAIGHRGIVDIYDFGTTPDGRDYVVMEQLTGEPLDRVITERAPLRPAEVAEILVEVCDALAAAHCAGVIHRDLKPSNVFLVLPPHGTRYVKLFDFGLAKQAATPYGASAQTHESVAVGTPYYMAPEQARGEPVSPQTDLYALGCVAFEMLTGKVPFEAPTPLEVISEHLLTPAPSVSVHVKDVPAAFDDLVHRLMAKDAKGRPASASDVRRALEEIGRRLHAAATWPEGLQPVRLEDEEPPPVEAAARADASPPGPAGAPVPARARAIDPSLNRTQKNRLRLPGWKVGLAALALGLGAGALVLWRLLGR